MGKKFCALLLCGAIMALACGSTACSAGDQTEAVDPTKIQLNVGVFDGGFGSEWLYNVKARFEKDYADFTVGDKKGVKETILFVTSLSLLFHSSFNSLSLP